jgi:SH3-like domain-containing protein
MALETMKHTVINPKYLVRMLSCFLLTLAFSTAEAKGKLPIPRFVSIKSSEANMRTGPDVRYPIKWVYVKKHEPVEIIAEFEHWRKIRDKQGDVGWVHENMVSGKRFIVIIAEQKVLVLNKPKNDAKGVFWIEPEVRAQLLTCEKDWCKIQSNDMKGWIDRKQLWGIYKDEIIK